MTSRTSHTRRVLLGLESLTPRVVPAATHLIAVGQDIGGASIVQVYNEDGSLNRSFSPFGSAFTGGVHVATGDVTGDGTDDLIVAPGIGGGPEVKVFDGATNAVVRDFFAYDEGFRGGVNLAVGDVNGDGHDDIITGTGTGGGPNVKAFDGANGNLLTSFFAYESTFRGGVNVAAGDVNGDGKADLITGTGVGGGPRVQVFDGASGAELSNFFAYNSSVRSGVNVAAGDLHGDGTADIVTGVGPGGGPNVRVFDGLTTALENSFFAYDQGFLGGVAVDVVHAKGATDILVAPGPSYGGFVELFDGATGAGVSAFEPFPSFKGGITTGQGVASAAAPFANVFAMPVVFATPPTSGSSGDTSGYGAPDGGDYNWGDVVNSTNNYTPDMSWTYTPPTDSGYTAPTDSGYVATDTSSYDSGSYDSGGSMWCGCDDFTG